MICGSRGGAEVWGRSGVWVAGSAVPAGASEGVEEGSGRRIAGELGSFRHPFLSLLAPRPALPCIHRKVVVCRRFPYERDSHATQGLLSGRNLRLPPGTVPISPPISPQCRHEWRHGTQECVRHIGRRGLPAFVSAPPRGFVAAGRFTQQVAADNCCVVRFAELSPARGRGTPRTSFG